MSTKIKDTDYLVISARIKAMENSLLTRDRMEQMLETRSDEEIVRILQDCGYPEFSTSNPEEMDAALSTAREGLLQDLGDSAPDPRYLEIFKLKYDYHNAKVLLKASATDVDPDHMLIGMGRVAPEELKKAVSSGETGDMPPMLASGIVQAKEILDTTRDPQLSDVALDRWCYRDMMAVADATGSDFLRGYVRESIDSVNLRTLVRTLRMGKNADFLKGALLEGGKVAEESILTVANASGSGLTELYAATTLKSAAEAGTAALNGGPLTEFEKLCDDAISEYLSGAQFVPFGEAPLVAYLAAKETEYTNLRIILMGRKAGLDPDVIRSRLRTSYL